MDNSGLAGLAQLALIIAAARKQGIYGRRTAQEELANQRADRDRRERAFQLQVDQAKQEQERQAKQDAYQRASPFFSMITDPDRLLELQRSGLLPGVLGAAKGAFGEAGLGIDLSGLAGRAGLREATTPSYIPGPGVSINPEADQGFLTGILPQAKPASSRFMPRMELAPQEPLKVSAPPRIEMGNRTVNPEVLSGLPPALRAALGGLVAPAGQVAVPLPDIERAVESQLQPSLRTEMAQGKLDNATLLALARQLLMGEQGQLANARAGDITATQPGRIENLEAGAGLKRATTGLTKARTSTEGLRPALVQAQTAATKSIPGYRQGQLQLGEKRIETTKRGQDIGAATSAADRASRATIAGANLEERIATRLQRVKLATEKARKVGAPREERDVFGQNMKILTTFRSTKAGPMPAYPNAERERAAAGVRAFGQKWGLDLSGVGLGDYSGAAAGGAGTVGSATGRDSSGGGGAAAGGTISDELINAVSAAERNGTYRKLYEQTSPANRPLVDQALREVKRRRQTKGGR